VGGGFGEVVAVEEHMLYPLGEIPLEYAAVIEPLAVVQHAVVESGITRWKDKTVLVLGGGPIGFALLLVLRAHGATNVVVSEPASLRRQQVSEYAQAVIDPTKEHVGDKCRELTDGRGVDVVFDCAGVPIALEAGCDAIKNSGLYMMVAVWEVSNRWVFPMTACRCAYNYRRSRYKCLSGY
jgi:(R,R)-butanediol dehydrogenase/meso-butanediol dehydrogenase/diacetyl reductase